MTGINDRELTSDPEISAGLLHSLILLLLGASIGAFWREVFHLTTVLVQRLTQPG